jgi:hypothetical protein
VLIKNYYKYKKHGNLLNTRDLLRSVVISDWLGPWYHSHHQRRPFEWVVRCWGEETLSFFFFFFFFFFFYLFLFYLRGSPWGFLICKFNYSHKTWTFTIVIENRDETTQKHSCIKYTFTKYIALKF